MRKSKPVQTRQHNDVRARLAVEHLEDRAVPAVLIDNGSAGYSETGSWSSWGQGYGGQFRYAAATSGSATATATWQAGSLAAGSYEVAATWVADPNRSVSQAFQVYDGSTLLQTVTVNERNAPSGTSTNGSVFQSLGTFTITSGTVRVVSTNATTGGQYVTTDAVRIDTPLPPPAGAPVVVDNGSAGYSETGSWSSWGQGYGSQFRYAAATSGAATATATWQAGSLAAGSYEVAATWVADPNRSVSQAFQVYDGSTLLQTVTVNERNAPSGTSTNGSVFQSLGTFTITSGTVRVVSTNATTGGQYVTTDAVRITAVSNPPISPPASPPVSPPPAVSPPPVSPPPAAGPSTVLIDNGSAGYSETGSWSSWGQGYGSQFRYAAATSGSATATATWQAGSLATGIYDVGTTWVADPNRSVSQVFQVYDGNTLLATVTVNERNAPSGTSTNGSVFQSLGTFTITSGTVRVVSTNATTGGQYVTTDAVRVSWSSALSPTAEVSVLDNNGNDLTDGSSTVAFGSTVTGAAVTKTFTVRNLGAQPLVLGAISVPAGFTLVSGFGSSTLTAGQSTTFTVRMDAAAAGSYGGAISFATNDSDENPFNFNVSGTVAAAGGFSITVRGSGLTASQQAIFQQAADRWAQIIVGDLPNMTYGGVVVDDLLIDASSVYIDGAGGILGSAGPDALRPGTFLPYHGEMEFDSADMASMEANGRLLAVVMHEMGHVLGIGTIWQHLGLLSGYGGSNPMFTGAQATAEYNARFGTTSAGVPVESGGGAGTAYGHWSEAVFGSELMTGWLNQGTTPLSRVTVASLADLGYTVNMNAADPF